jgi:hypothetical protein
MAGTRMRLFGASQAREPGAGARPPERATAHGNRRLRRGAGLLEDEKKKAPRRKPQCLEDYVDPAVEGSEAEPCAETCSRGRRSFLQRGPREPSLSGKAARPGLAPAGAGAL